jgi:hypothetical protein
MANRYWVGGTASWDGTAGIKWALTDGGAGGQAVPTSADDVFFATSSTGTVTIAAGNTGAKTINCTGFTGTITGTAAITVSGSITLVSGMTYTHTGTVTIDATATLTTAGKSFSGLTINASGGTVTLGDALSISNRTITVTNGTFTTANYNVTAGDLLSSNSNTRTITLGSSTVTLSAFSPLWGVSPNVTGLTFNANTSELNLTSYSVSLQGAFTYYNVTIGNSLNNTHTIAGANTFNNLTFVDRANSGTNSVTFNANQTINGTLTANSGVTVPYRRVWFLSNTSGTNRTLTAAALNLKYVDFRNITGAGAASWTDSSRTNYWGDTGGNSGITFAAGRSAYWNLAGSQNWTSTGWALTNNGSPNVNNYPLVQDIATFTEAGSAGTIVLDTQGLMIGDITMADGVSNRTTAFTLNFGAFDRDNIFGSVTLFSNLSVTGGGTSREFIFSGYNKTQTLTSAGVTFPVGVAARNGYLHTLQLNDAISITSTRNLTIASDSVTFSPGNYNVTTGTFNASGSQTRTVNMGSGTWTLSGTGSVWDTSTTTALTLNKDTANITLSNTSTTARTFTGGGLSYNKLTIGGTTGISTLTITGANSYSELASTKTVAHTITLSNNLGTITTWSVTGTSGNVVTLNSSSAGTRRTFTLTNVTSGIDYMSVTDIGVTDNNRFYVGANSTNGGNNNNVIFTAAPATATGNFFMVFQ